ncbi:MAG: hypothetical protein HZA51_12715 [Planctomycetes bacterium]|nr:hypothetical protein [Planctomycetota bacterium]
MISLQNLASDMVSTGRMILWEFGNHLNQPGHRKEKTSLLFLARTIRQLQAISALADAIDFSDGWILFRSLLERYLLYCKLCEATDFDVFDDWCFKKQYEGLNSIKSIREFGGRPEMRHRKFTPEEQARYKCVCADQRVSQWQRPDMEAVARNLEMKFLYNVGYDWASSFVHPVSTDGESDYHFLMGRFHESMSEHSTPLIANACLIAAMHIQQFMNQPEYNWRRVLHDLVDAFAKTAGREELDYKETIAKVMHFHTSGAGLLSKPENKRS